MTALPRPHRLTRPLLPGILAAALASITLPLAADDVRFSTQSAPLLQKYCIGCHNRVSPEGGLSLQSADEIEKGGSSGPVLDRSNPAAGRLLQTLNSSGDDQMPPADQPQPTAAERKLLTDWLLAGAPFDSRLPILPKLPAIKSSQTGPGPAIAASISKDGTRLLSGHFRKAQITGLADNTPQWQIDIPDGKVTDVQFAAAEQQVLLATGTPGVAGRALLIDIASSQILHEFSGHADALYAAVLSPDETVAATAGYDRIIRLHDARSGKLLRELPGHNGSVFDLQFSPDGTLLASASADATIKIWHVASGQRFDTLSQPQAEQYSVAFSPDGRFIYGSGADSRIRQWLLVSRQQPQINPLQISRFAHEGTISLLQLSGDGGTLATTDESGIVKFWNAVTVEEISATSLAADPPLCAVMNSAERSLLLPARNGSIRRLPWPVAQTTVTMKTPESPATPVTATSTAPQELTETEPNNAIAEAPLVSIPANIKGTVHTASGNSPDSDLFRISARKGQTLLIEVQAARDKSPLDSLVDVLTTDGQPVLQTRLQAVRDSWFTFRGKDSDTSDDFRMFNWQEMELNEYLYADGEVVKLWLYPRGPDSGFKVYPGFGQRQTWFNTTPSTHPLQGPAFIVVPQAPDAVLKDTGLPVFPIYAENDDDPQRQWGADSRLMFTSPADGEYVVRLRDARGFQGPDFTWTLRVREPQPDFTVAASTAELKIHAGTGREISFTATRLDGFSGPIRITAENLPPGFYFSDPVEIQYEQRQAFAAVLATPDAVAPTAEAVAAIRFHAEADIHGKTVRHEIGGLKTLELLQNPKIKVILVTDEQKVAGQFEHTPELIVRAGQTTRAWLKVERIAHDGIVEFGKEDSGRNLPHGVFVDNIGLNGLMLLAGQNEREVFITAARWAPAQTRPFFLKSSIDGGITTLPVQVRIIPASGESQTAGR
ncbi:MAG: c-type cytochrome domain-containing protein [Planctomyces sp.]